MQKLSTPQTFALALLLSLSIIVPASLVSSDLRAFMGPSARSAAPVRATAAGSGAYFDYVVFIIMENHAICDILTSCGGAAPYMTTLANGSGLSTKTVDCNTPSLPNYLCLSGASDFGCAGYDGLPDSNACTAAAWNATNIVDRLEAGGLTWKAYMESMPSNCAGADSGLYMAHHDPFVYYSDIVTNPARCARVIPAGANASTLVNDLGSTTTASNFMWLTPNSCDDMHGCSVATGDAFLKGLVPEILASSVFTSQRAALFITFDEDSGGLGAPDVYSVWSGPAAKKTFISANPYDHFSFLKTVEANWNLASLNTNDGNAVAMAEFFGAPAPAFVLTATPSSLNAAAGHPVNATIGLTASGGFTGTVTLNASSQPTGPTVSVSPTSIAPGQTATCTINAAATGTFTVTVTGTSGTLVRTVSIAVTVGVLAADFSFAPSAPSAGQTLDFTASVVGGTAPYVYAWRFGDGSNGTGAAVAHAYAAAGNYAVALTASDSAGHSSTASHPVVVGPPGSGLSVSFSLSPPNPVPGALLTFAAVATQGTAPYTFAWQFGDGATATGANVSHAYPQAGTFTVNVTVTDAKGGSASSIQAVTIGGGIGPGAPSTPASIVADLPFVGLLGVVVIVVAVALRGRDDMDEPEEDQEPESLEDSEDSLDD